MYDVKYIMMKFENDVNKMISDMTYIFKYIKSQKYRNKLSPYDIFRCCLYAMLLIIFLTSYYHMIMAQNTISFITNLKIMSFPRP